MSFSARIFQVKPTERPSFYHVKPGVDLLAGEYPGGRSQSNTKKRIAWLLGFGVNTFIDLTDCREIESSYSGLLPSGVEYHTFGIADGTASSLPRIQEILDRIDTELADDRKVYLHCLGGRGRTGMVVGCWLVRHGMAPQNALGEVQASWQGSPRGLSNGGSSPETPQQREAILHWRYGD